jgi:hypothetical protein
MRELRPHLFSDSEIVPTLQLSRAVLDHYLDTLTNRKEENEFEHFSRRLAEKEICPNLRPQTGPSGGGDSKVDSETYPVSSEISLRWYKGDQAAAHENWAFAFSAKKDWRGKVRSDVKNVLSTGRTYHRIYFISNQYIPDKLRSEVEKAQSGAAGIPVYILDRSWLLSRVFDHNRIDIAIDTLGLDNKSIKSDRRSGPRDVEREAKLKEIDQQIDDQERYAGVEYQLAQDCLDSALLARGLERPRTEVDGRFVRAERVAKEINYTPQLLRIAYAKAWTAFWWYDDFKELNRLYDDVEGYGIQSELVGDLELIFNLWNLLTSASRRGALTEADAKCSVRTERLRAALQKLSKDNSRP